MIIMSVDLGRSRTGLAVCDATETLSRPVTVLHQKDMDMLCLQVSRVAATLRAGIIVMGLPVNMDGTEGESARFAWEMGARIGEMSGVPVEFVDERGTTITANRLLNDSNTRGKKRRAKLDGIAASVILEDFLMRRRNEAERERQEQEEDPEGDENAPE